MTDRDLTPAEARAEIEAFMGEGWTFFSDEAPRPVWTSIRAYNCRLRIRVVGEGQTYRAAVSALKQAWRDAVRPWCVQSAQDTYNATDRHGDMSPETPESIVARVLKEDSNG